MPTVEKEALISTLPQQKSSCVLHRVPDPNPVPHLAPRTTNHQPLSSTHYPHELNADRSNPSPQHFQALEAIAIDILSYKSGR